MNHFSSGLVLAGVLASGCGSGDSTRNSTSAPNDGSDVAGAGQSSADTLQEVGPGVACPFVTQTQAALSFESEYSEEAIACACGSTPPRVTLTFYTGGALRQVSVGDDVMHCEPEGAPASVFNEWYFTCDGGEAPGACMECFDEYRCGSCAVLWGRNGHNQDIWALALDCQSAMYTTHSDVGECASCPLGESCVDGQCRSSPTGGDECSNCLEACRGLPSCCQGAGCICDNACGA